MEAYLAWTLPCKSEALPSTCKKCGLLDSPVPREIVWALAGKEGPPHGPNPKEINFEPHVARDLFKEMLHNVSAQVTVVPSQLGIANVGTSHSGSTPVITNFTTRAGRSFSAKYFIDCSYEGDLVRFSGVPFTWGREANTTYNESMAGVIDYGTAWPASIDPYVDGPGSPNLPYIQKPNAAPQGSADGRIMSMNFRMCLTNAMNNSVPLPVPKAYNSSLMEAPRRWLKSIGNGSLTLDNFFLVRHLPKNKIDLNAGKALFSSDFPGAFRGLNC